MVDKMHFIQFSRIFSKLRSWFIEYLVRNNLVIINYNSPRKRKIFQLVRHIREKALLKGNEGYQLFIMVKELCKKRKGALAEVGVYRGGSTKLICEAKGDNPLYAFDTFDGLPPLTKEDVPDNEHQSSFMDGDFKDVTLESVKRYLSEYQNVFLFKGLFPNSANKTVKSSKYIFVHLDVDLYNSTLDSLLFFYPKLLRGGMILSHDYSTAPGVKKAFDEFFEDKKETVIELPGSQCLVMKL